MKAKEYEVLHRAVEEGILLGWNRAHKHWDGPPTDAVRDPILEAIQDAVMLTITEWFDFDPTPRGED